jgi:hypothetical protein
VADRFVLPTLSQEDIASIASGRHGMDALVRRYIHDELLYRYIIVQDGKGVGNRGGDQVGRLGSRAAVFKSSKTGG